MNTNPKSQPPHDQARSTGDWTGGCTCASQSWALRSRHRNFETAPDDPLEARLREMSDVLDSRDRLMGRAARLLVQVNDADGLHDRLGGMTLQVWLEHVCRLPGADARQLLGVVDVLAHLPSVLTGLCDGWLSWAQVVAISGAARRVRVGLLADLDDLVADAMVRMADVEPDAIVDDVWQWVDTRQPTRLEREERARDRGEFVALQPRLTGGGSNFGELGTVSFGIVAESLSADSPPPTSPAGSGASVPASPEELARLDQSEVHDLYATLDEQSRAHTRDHGAVMAARLVDLCSHELAGTSAHGDGAQPHRTSRPLVIATIDVEALCDTTRTPGWLLHTLAGGRMKLSAATLHRLVDERGADLRGIVLDDCGQVVGVGRRTRVPPGWLRQAIWARDMVVADPDGFTPVRRADLDHITAWPDGATDVTNLHPLGRRWHNHKTDRTWTVSRELDGATTWRHHRHGWTLRMAAPRRTLAQPPRAGPPPPTHSELVQRQDHPNTQPRLSQPQLTGVP